MCLCLFPLVVQLAIGSELEQDLRTANDELQSHMPRLNDLVNDGQLAQANEQLLNFYPQATRTAAQSLLLGNLLYNMDRNLSYTLHQEAAKAFPHEPIVQLEWAMEQHRAGEYGPALASYDIFSKANPDYAPVHGMAADCLIRLGRIRDAVERWKLSEKAKTGSLIDLESLVCAVYGNATLFQKRADFRAKAGQGDIDAAVRLIALDCDFERDWWNAGPQRAYIKNDLSVIDELKGDRISAAKCTGECHLLEDAQAEDIRSILLKYRYLIDPAHTVPEDAQLLSLLLGIATSKKVMSLQEARSLFGKKLHDRATNSPDAALWNVVAFLYREQPELKAIEKEAWDATGDPRFALGYLAERPENDPLKADDPLLLKAMQQFPEDSWIMYLVITSTRQPTAEQLAQAIKAEFRHFSATGFTSSINGRPSARTLRAYFSALSQLAK